MKYANKYGKTDLRIQRTQKAIVDAFYDLLDERSFNAITVIDICNRALINRGTFYTHFDDKYALLDKCICDIMYGLHEQVKRAHGDSDLITYYNEVMSLGITFLDANRKRIRAIILKAENSLVFDKVHDILTDNIKKRLNSTRPRNGGTGSPSNIIAEFFSGGIIFLIKWWLLDSPNYTLEDIRKQLSIIAEKTLSEYCDK